VVSITLRPRFTPGKGPPIPIVQEAGWAPEPVWTQRLTLSVFENKMLRKIFGSEIEGTRERCRKLHCEELHKSHNVILWEDNIKTNLGEIVRCEGVDWMKIGQNRVHEHDGEISGPLCYQEIS
jgi:hypothetical protein